MDLQPNTSHYERPTMGNENQCEGYSEQILNPCVRWDGGLNMILDSSVAVAATNNTSQEWVFVMVGGGVGDLVWFVRRAGGRWADVSRQAILCLTNLGFLCTTLTLYF